MNTFAKLFSLVGFKKTKNRRHKKQKRRRTQRKRSMRGGWGGAPDVKLNDVNLTKGGMKGGWGPPVAPM